MQSAARLIEAKFRGLDEPALNLWRSRICSQSKLVWVQLTPQFNRYLVSLGQRRSWGFTARYNF